MKKALSIVGLLVCIIPLPLHAKDSLSPKNIIAYANQDRLENNVETLTESALLDRAAQKKADDMAAQGYFSHTDPEGRAPWVWFSSVNYYYLRAGENLAVNFDDAQTLNTAWMNSPTHRANIVKQTYTEVGIGISQGTYQGRPATFVVQFFATPASRALAKR